VRPSFAFSVVTAMVGVGGLSCASKLSSSSIPDADGGGAVADAASESASDEDADLRSDNGLAIPDASTQDSAELDLGSMDDDAGPTNQDGSGNQDAAPAPDASNLDACVDDGGSPIPCPGPFVFCEDFENGIDTNIWTLPPSGMQIDSSRAHRGAHSILFTQDGATMLTYTPFPRLATDLWARVFVYLDATPPGGAPGSPDYNSSFSWSAGGQGDSRVGFRSGALSGGFNYPNYDVTNTDNGSWPLNQWICVEWHYRLDSTTRMGTQDYWQDGVYRPMASIDTHPMDPFTYFWIGEYIWGSNSNVWLDDLVLDTSRVGCSR
jgi:hypothetical protein